MARNKETHTSSLFWTCSTILHTIRLGGLRRRSLSVEFFLSFSFSGDPFYGHKIPLTDKPLRK